jgi:hypothetical protein
MQTSRNVALAIVTLAALAAGCSSVPAPKEQMAVAHKAVERAGATPDVVALAPTEIDRARVKIAAAERAMARKDYRDARRLAEEAEADARAAEARAEAAKNERAVSEVNQAMKALRDELQRRPAA